MRSTRFLFQMSLVVAILLFHTTVPSLAADAPKAAEKMVIVAKTGNVTFLHAKHAERLKCDCKACHSTLFKESVKEPLGYKTGIHKTAEKAKASCAACHVTGGAAFPSTGNCKKCHVK